MVKKKNNTKDKVVKTTKTIERTVDVVEAPKGECYTFISNVSIGKDIYGIGERVMLTKEDLIVYGPFVVLTSEYKGRQHIATKSKGCGC